MGDQSNKLYQKAINLIPGGVNSPVRAGRSVGRNPLFISRAEGCFLWDEDGKKYIDYVGSWGPMILGHGHPDVLKAIEQRLQLGTSYGAPTALEVQMAETITKMVPSIEMVRLVNSGTEATMSALRLARGFTGKDKIIKFEGCYHGHVDSLLVSAGSGVATLGIPGSPGVPADLAKQTLSLPFNQLDPVVRAFENHGADIAAIIVEPIPGNMGVVLPKDGFLKGLREITRENEALLIFDEVISGFRVAPGGAQEVYGIRPDLTCLGKIIGGGLPVGAYGGPKEIMSRIAPEGDIYQAGTLSGNPLAMAAGLATLKMLQQENIYQELEQKSKMLFSGLKDAAEEEGLKVTINRFGSMGSLFFNQGPVFDFDTVRASDTEMFKQYYGLMLDQGVYLAPSAFEASFISLAHDQKVIQETIEAARRCWPALAKTS